jgi:hypothetical protein
MSLLRALCALSTSLVLVQSRRLAGYRHEAFDVQVGQAEPTDVSTIAIHPTIHALRFTTCWLLSTVMAHDHSIGSAME